jgi:hypothetical protein
MPLTEQAWLASAAGATATLWPAHQRRAAPHAGREAARWQRAPVQVPIASSTPLAGQHDEWQAGVPRRLVCAGPRSPTRASSGTTPAAAPAAARPVAREVELRLVVDNAPGATDPR